MEAGPGPHHSKGQLLPVPRAGQAAHVAPWPRAGDCERTAGQQEQTGNEKKRQPGLIHRETTRNSHCALAEPQPAAQNRLIWVADKTGEIKGQVGTPGATTLRLRGPSVRKLLVPRHTSPEAAGCPITVAGSLLTSLPVLGGTGPPLRKQHPAPRLRSRGPPCPAASPRRPFQELRGLSAPEAGDTSDHIRGLTSARPRPGTHQIWGPRPHVAASPAGSLRWRSPAPAPEPDGIHPHAENPTTWAWKRNFPAH